MPQRSIAAAIASRPAVKFRLTGTLAGDRDGDVGERAADRGRQQQADVRVAGASRRMARESSRLPTSARPKVSSRPVESAMQNDDQRRFAVSG